MDQKQDQENRDTNSRSYPGALKWACETLELNQRNQAIEKKETRRQAVESFFNGLKSNGFYPEADKAQAVEVIFGKPVQSVLACSRAQKKQQFQKLDETVAWFASQLGEKPSEELLSSLSERLSGFDSYALSCDADGYAKKIWQIAQSVESRVDGGDPAVKKLVQALFHISTVRQTRRCQVRRQWLEELREDYSIGELVKAKSVVQRSFNTPNNKFHRPFLHLLTCEDDSLDQVRIASPVDSRVQSTASQINRNSRFDYQTQTDRGLGFIFALAAIAGIAGVFFAQFKKPYKPPPQLPFRNFNIDSDDKQMLESFQFLLDEKEEKQILIDRLEERRNRDKQDWSLDADKKYVPNQSLVPDLDATGSRLFDSNPNGNTVPNRNFSTQRFSSPPSANFGPGGNR